MNVGVGVFGGVRDHEPVLLTVRVPVGLGRVVVCVVMVEVMEGPESVPLGVGVGSGLVSRSVRVPVPVGVCVGGVAVHDSDGGVGDVVPVGEGSVGVLV